MTDPLDSTALDAIEARAKRAEPYGFSNLYAAHVVRKDVPALIAALRQARADNERLRAVECRHARLDQGPRTVPLDWCDATKSLAVHDYPAARCPGPHRRLFVETEDTDA